MRVPFLKVPLLLSGECLPAESGPAQVPKTCKWTLQFCTIFCVLINFPPVNEQWITLKQLVFAEKGVGENWIVSINRV